MPLSHLFCEQWATLSNLVPQGGTHMLRHTGMCHNFASVFCKKSLNMDPIFHEKILNFGSDFKNFPNPRKIWKFSMFLLLQNPKKWILFFKIIPKLVPFFGKITSEYGYGFWAAGVAAHPRPIHIWVPPSSLEHLWETSGQCGNCQNHTTMAILPKVACLQDSCCTRRPQHTPTPPHTPTHPHTHTHMKLEKCIVGSLGYFLHCCPSWLFTQYHLCVWSFCSTQNKLTLNLTYTL